MALLGMRDVSVAFGGAPVLERATLGIERGERVCLLGRNGAGKSMLMNLLDGSISPDSGEVLRQTGATVTRLEQEVPGDLGGTTFDGGVGGVHGTILGILILAILGNTLNLLGISPFVQMLLQGVIIVLAVILSDVRSRLKR